MSIIARHRWLTGSGVLLAIVVVAALVFQWDWLIPIVDSQASTALGRPVTITHLHVALGRVTRIEADGVTIENPKDWPGGGTFVTAKALAVSVQPLDYIWHRAIVIPDITVDTPNIDAQQTADGRANWTFGGTQPASPTPNPSPGPTIGTLHINDGHVHVRDAKLRADFNVAIATKDDNTGASQITADAQGTYAAQPITAQFIGGALLSLQDAARPYPVDLHIANGPTRVALTGTIKDPLAFKGADLKLEFAGPDMSLLLPLTGVAIPKTPPYRVAGHLDYGNGVVKFDDFTGKVGSTDLAGDIDVDTRPARPLIDATLSSRLVDLKDLGGFIGAQPGDASKGTKTPTPASANGRVLPSTPISLPKLNVADVRLRYRAARIEGRRDPLENMRVDLDILDGNIILHPISFGIGHGELSANIDLSEAPAGLHAKADVDFNRIDIDSLLTSAGIGHGAGVIGGKAVIDGTGRSVAGILGDANGEVKLFMGHGGNLSALLVDLSGLEFGRALLSALGIPDRAALQCLIADIVLHNGLAEAKTMLIDTDEAEVGITGDVNLHDERIDLAIKTQSKHFSIGSLPTPLDVTGSLASPSIAPAAGPLALRGGAAIALGIVATPLAALLPTIQFGTGDDHACSGLLESIKTPPKANPTAHDRVPRPRG
jgi:uncharacterized protein involved in outer membrane biogenesis